MLTPILWASENSCIEWRRLTEILMEVNRKGDGKPKMLPCQQSPVIVLLEADR